jgi:hypothetical protein
VPSHRHRVDQIVSQQLEPAMTTRRGSGHWHGADWLRVLDLWQTDDDLQSGFWQRIIAFSSSRRGDFSGGNLHRLGGFSGSLLSPRCHILNGHRRRDLASLGFSTCQ